jgi:hypothetical protein
METIEIENKPLAVEWLFEERFESDDWQSRWTVESQSPRVFTEGGRLKIRPVYEVKETAGVSVWYNDELPQDVVISIKASTEPVVENNACNLNFFIHARESGGGDLRFNRSGLYDDYHTIDNYTFTLTGGFQPGWARVRLNPGFVLASERADVRSEPGKHYTFLIVIQGKRLRYELNGECLHDIEVETPLRAGWFGLRSWCSFVNFEAIKIGRIVG